MQLPTYDGTKSYQNLLVGVYGMRVDVSWAGYLLDTQIAQSPLTFIRSGRYDYSYGGIDYRSGYGYDWQTRVASETNAGHLLFGSNYLYPQYDSNYKGYGFTVRCLVR